MAITKLAGIGADGYIRIRKHTAGYESSDSGAYKDLPYLSSTSISFMTENIESTRRINSRFKPANYKGFKKISGNLDTEMHPAFAGYFLDLFLRADGAGVKDSNESFWTNTFSAPSVTEELTGNLCDILYRKGGGTDPIEFSSCTLTQMTISCENGATSLMNFNLVSRDAKYETHSSFTPSFSPLLPYVYSDLKVMDKTNNHEILTESFNLTLDLNYKFENFKLGSILTKRPIFNGIPSVSVTLNSESAQSFKEQAENHELINLEITFETPQIIAGSQNYKTVIDLPKCQLSPDTKIEDSDERMMTSLEFDCNFEGFSFQTVDGEDQY